MTKYAAIFLVLVLAGQALARDETLLGEELESGGYGALVVKYGQIRGTDGIFVGGQGGWIINHTLVIGAAGYGLVNQIGSGRGDCTYLGFGYGGLLLEFIIASHKLVHLSVQGVIGGGGVGYYTDRYCDYYCVSDGDAFFALEPGAHLMLNLHRIVRVGIGASYRYVDGVRYEDLRDSDLSGYTGQFIIKFGLF